MQSEKAVEARLRRKADAAGLKLVKLRGRDEPYIVTDVDTGGLAFPWEYGLIGEGASLEAVRDYLTA